jgi:arylsulfatase A-like enzyme
MRFTDGYATCQVCSPSRASIMTGKYTPRHGITDWIGAGTGLKWNRNDRVLPPEYVHNLPAEDTTLAEAMKAGGYKTFFAGKWHLGKKGSHPEDHGFDINKGGHYRGGPPGGYFSPYKNPKLQDGPAGESLTMRLASETCNFIEANANEPFFAYLSFYTVHGPIQTTEKLWKKYRDKAQADGLAEKRFKFDRKKAVRQVQDNPIYAGMMEILDDAVGMVIDKLKALGIEDDTVVIFTSDNGGVSSGDAFSTSLLPYRGGKGRQWEGGIRVPYYIKAPKVTLPGTVCDTPVIATDFYPTILDLAGLKPLKDQHLDGVSIVELLKGKNIAKRDLFWHYPHYGNQGGEPSAIIRRGNFKLIHYYEDGRDELYDLSKDIGEMNDIAAKHPNKTRQLSTRLHAWLKETDAKIPVADKRFNPEKKKKQIARAKTKELEGREKYYRDVQKPDWKPKNNWWGSGVAKD